MERELAVMTGLLEHAVCWAVRKGRGGGELVFGSRLRELFARVLVARILLIEGAMAFKHKKCILERKVFAEIECWPKGVGQLSSSRGGRGGGV